MSALPPALQERVALYLRDRSYYESESFNEEQCRVEFINPLFEALGWDVSNRAGKFDAFKDVEHEGALKVGGRVKAPDYAFRIGGTRVFFVEAKKPKVWIYAANEPCYQLRRYAWSAGLPVSVLTNFREFAVFDTQVKPLKDDGPHVARVLYVKVEEYEQRGDEIEALFSRSAVERGSLHRFARETRKRGTGTVDSEFLAWLEDRRDALAGVLSKRNPGLGAAELQFAVQAILNRLLFLRICEDRGIEPLETLAGLRNGTGVYQRLVRVFERADDRYDSGLFHFRDETGRATQPDRLTPGLVVDDYILKEILADLYYPRSPYAFDAVPTEILGSVYERFLGKVLEVPKAGKVRSVEKPEVRKAGGVYYTPAYIVDRVVRDTLSPLLEGRSPADIATLRIVDPACGSGSFLLGAYDFLMTWFLERYVAGGTDRSPDRVFRGPGGQWRLTPAEKRRILTTHLFGVDKDPQAVEVAKFSLLLKMLEGEHVEVLERDARHSGRRILPDLDRNVRCGNSLIGPEFYQAPERQGLSDDALAAIRPFDWRAAFPEVFEAGGFDAVIGNPPYVRIQNMKEYAPVEVEYFKRTYRSAASGNYDLYVVFVERGLSLLNERGRLGFILPNKFMNAKYGRGLREILAAGRHLSRVVHFGDQQVFDGATTYTCLLFLDKAGAATCRVEKVSDLETWRTAGEAEQGEMPAERFGGGEWNLVVGKGESLFDRLAGMPIKLEGVTDRIFQGVKTSADKIFIVEERERTDQGVLVFCPHDGNLYLLEPGLLHPLVKGGDSHRYHLQGKNLRILFPYIEGCDGKRVLADPVTLRQDYPLTWEYFLRHRRHLEEREGGRMRGPKWYGYVYPKALDVMPLPKIFTPDIAPSASYSLDRTGEFFFTGGVAGGYGILVREGVSQSWILGLLNSRLLDWFVAKVSSAMRGGWRSYEARFIKGLPIVLPDRARPDDRRLHDLLVDLVERMLDLHKRLPQALPHEAERLRTEIAATDRQIDEIVYRLYNLTDAEVRLVEKG